MVTPREGLAGPSSSGGLSAQRVAPFEGAAGAQVSALGSAMADAGAKSFTLSQAMQRDLDNAKFQEASARYAELLATTETEFEQLQGEDAHKKFDEFRHRLDVKRAELEKYLTSERQREAFGRDSSTRQAVTLNRMNARRADQLKAHRIGATTASLDRAMRDRVTAQVKGDTVDFIRQSMVMHRKLNDLAELNGLSDEQRTLAQDKAEEAVTVAGIEGLIEIGALGRAREALESSPLLQDPVKRQKLKDRLDTANVKQQAEGLVDEVRNQGGFLKQRRYIRDMDVSVEVKDELRQRMRAIYDEDRMVQAHSRADALSRAADLDDVGEPWPETLETELKELGVLGKAKAARNNTTTEEGHRVLNTLTPEQITAFPTPEALYETYGHMLSRADANALVARWYRFAEVEMVRKASQEGSAGSQRTGATARNEQALMRLDQQRAIRVAVANASPVWEEVLADADGKLKGRWLLKMNRIEEAVRDRLDYLNKLGVPMTNDLFDNAVKEVLSARTATGEFYAQLGRREVEETDLSVTVGGKPHTFNLARISQPGAEGGVVDGRTRLEDTMKLLRAEAVAEAMRPREVNGVVVPGMSAEDARTWAMTQVSEYDAINYLGQSERADELGAQEANAALSRGETVDLEAAARFGPKVQARNNALLTLRSTWENFMGTQLLRPEHASVERDDAAFIRLWGAYHDTFKDQLQAFGVLGPDEETLRRQAIDTLFPKASSTARHRLWRMSGAGAPPGRFSAVGEPIEGYHLQGYLRTTPTELEFSYQ